MSWWELGESGYSGASLGLFRITCAFCMETGNFEIEHHAEKRKPNSGKTLNFDTYKCHNCAGYVMVLWSASESGARIHDYHVLPWPLKVGDYPEPWPDAIGKFWVQAQANLQNEYWDAAAMTARSALQAAVRDKGASGNNLKQEIDDLAAKGILAPILKEWADQIRLLGNESAHPDPMQVIDPQDARDIVKFLTFLLEYLYTFPHQIQQYRNRQ